MPATSQNDSNIYQVVEAITCLHIRAFKTVGDMQILVSMTSVEELVEY